MNNTQQYITMDIQSKKSSNHIITPENSDDETTVQHTIHHMHTDIEPPYHVNFLSSSTR